MLLFRHNAQWRIHDVMIIIVTSTVYVVRLNPNPISNPIQMHFVKLRFMLTLIRNILIIHLYSIVFPRNIQPKSGQSTRNSAASAYASVVTSIPKSSPAIQAHQQSLISQRFRENGQSLLNSGDQSSNKLQIGRQGQIKDVQSIIANFRQTHPEVVPRRGRRLKNVNNMFGSDQGSATDTNDVLVSDLLISKRNNDISSPPSSNDSTYSNSQILLSKTGGTNQFGSISAGYYRTEMFNSFFSDFFYGRT